MAKNRRDAKYLFDNMPGYGSKFPKRETLDIPEGIRQQKVKVTMEQLLEIVAKAPHNLEFQIHNFAVDVSIRALTVFRRSFSDRRFYSAEGKPWPMLTEATIRKRTRRGTWPGDGVLREYNNLYKSLTRKSTTTTKRIIESVYTDPNKFPGNRAYGGIHNDPQAGDTYGTLFGMRPVKRRQFMGFSTYIDSFENQYMDRYLFHAVFGVPKAADITKVARSNVRQY